MLKIDYFHRDSTNRTLEHKRQKLSDHTEHVQGLKSQVNELKNDQLTIEQNLQKRTALEDKKVELQTLNAAYEREIEVNTTLICTLFNNFSMCSNGVECGLGWLLGRVCPSVDPSILNDRRSIVLTPSLTATVS